MQQTKRRSKKGVILLALAIALMVVAFVPAAMAATANGVLEPSLELDGACSGWPRMVRRRHHAGRRLLHALVQRCGRELGPASSSSRSTAAASSTSSRSTGSSMATSRATRSATCIRADRRSTWTSAPLRPPLGGPAHDRQLADRDHGDRAPARPQADRDRHVRHRQHEARVAARDHRRLLLQRPREVHRHRLRSVRLGCGSDCRRLTWTDPVDGARTALGRLPLVWDKWTYEVTGTVNPVGHPFYGSVVVTFPATDMVGNIQTLPVTVNFDLVAPDTSYKIVPAGADNQNGWTNKPVTVTFTATDMGGAGVDYTEYIVKTSDTTAPPTTPGINESGMLATRSSSTRPRPSARTTSTTVRSTTPARPATRKPGSSSWSSLTTSPRLCRTTRRSGGSTSSRSSPSMR